VTFAFFFSLAGISMPAPWDGSFVFSFASASTKDKEMNDAGLFAGLATSPYGREREIGLISSFFSFD